VPNRIIKESICTSDTIDQLSPEEEVFFYRLIVNCDDYGRMDARPQILRAKCFPLRLNQIDEKLITQWLNRLMEVNLIMVYTVKNKAYLQVVTWNNHQQIRAKKSKYPVPGDSNGNQMRSNVPVIQSNPIQSNNILSHFENATENKNPKKPKNPDIKVFIDYYHDQFLSKFEEKPIIDGGKDGAIIGKLLKTHSLERLKELINAFFNSKDPFIQQSGYTIGVFKTQINKLLTENKRSQNKYGTRRAEE